MDLQLQGKVVGFFFFGKCLHGIFSAFHCFVEFLKQSILNSSIKFKHNIVVLILIIFKKYNALYVLLIDAQYYDLLFQHGAHAMLHNILRLTYFSLHQRLEQRFLGNFILSLPLKLLGSKKMNQKYSKRLVKRNTILKEHF